MPEGQTYSVEEEVSLRGREHGIGPGRQLPPLVALQLKCSVRCRDDVWLEITGI
jgi:hypothetical protein